LISLAFQIIKPQRKTPPYFCEVTPMMSRFLLAKGKESTRWIRDEMERNTVLFKEDVFYRMTDNTGDVGERRGGG
jgi:hypothetical protein